MLVGFKQALAAALASALMVVTPLYARPDNANLPRLAKGAVACEMDRTLGKLSGRCLKRLLRNPDVRTVLEQTQAFRDGRLNMQKLEEVAERLIVVEPVPLPENYNVDEEVAGEPLRTGPDGQPEPVFLDAEILRLLKAATPPVVEDTVIDRLLGPFTLQNLPSPPPPDPFPDPGFGFELPPPNPNQLDVLAFLQDLHQTLSPNVNGYAARIQQEGKTIGVLQWNWARNPSDLPALSWNSYRRMHVASISKFMTAIGLVHLLENSSGLDIDDSMASFLPTYWARFAGANELISFENLMNHRSGFSTAGSATNWATMKANVEAGVSAADVGVTFDYENMNFGLIRILVATIGEYLDPSTSFGSEFSNDALWDLLTWAAYEDYMRTYIFNPVGASPQIDKNTLTTLAYRFDATGNGWPSGNFAGRAGGVGWHMTIGELLDVTRSLRTNQIVDFFAVNDLLNGSLGLNSPVNGEPTAAGPIYYKVGRWTDNLNTAIGRTEQCILFMMPNNMELVVFVNSEVSANGTSLTNIVRTLFVNNIVTQ